MRVVSSAVLRVVEVRQREEVELDRPLEQGVACLCARRLGRPARGRNLPADEQDGEVPDRASPTVGDGLGRVGRVLKDELSLGGGSVISGRRAASRGRQRRRSGKLRSPRWPTRRAGTWRRRRRSGERAVIWGMSTTSAAPNASLRRERALHAARLVALHQVLEHLEPAADEVTGPAVALFVVLRVAEQHAEVLEGLDAGVDGLDHRAHAGPLARPPGVEGLVGEQSSQSSSRMAIDSANVSSSTFSAGT